MTEIEFIEAYLPGVNPHYALPVHSENCRYPTPLE